VLNIRPGEGAAWDGKPKCGSWSLKFWAVRFVSRDPPMLDKELIVGLDFGAMVMILNRNYLSNGRNVSLLIRWTDNRSRDFHAVDRDLPNLVWGLL